MVKNVRQTGLAQYKNDLACQLQKNGCIGRGDWKIMFETTHENSPNVCPPLSVVVHYGEIALKKGNRNMFEDHLVRNIRLGLEGQGTFKIRRLRGRIHIEFIESANSNDLMDRFSRIFGVANAASAVCCRPRIDDIQNAVNKIIYGRTIKTFAVRTRRADKRFSLTSQETNEIIGRAVENLCGAKVDLTNPETIISIEILNDHAFIYLNSVKGPGGLPVGISGKVACLISGGIDSPVAAWRAMKRGCEVVFIHFHSAPYTSQASQEKVFELVSHLMKWQPRTKLIMVPFGPVQQKIILGVPIAYRIVVYRRFMMRIAEELAKREQAHAIVTGEALSQVASQTLSNLVTIGKVLTMPVLRPLIGMDKQEIVDEAKKIGTFEIAIQPHDDCCSFLMPKNPVTKTIPNVVENMEQGLDVQGLINLGLESCTEIVI